MALFRCPRCHGSTATRSGSYFEGVFAPFWTPRRCGRCQLDFRDKTFWSPGNRRLRTDWLLAATKRAKSSSG
jgi:hypothetical protein